jgi:hypothetical protein
VGVLPVEELDSPTQQVPLCIVVMCPNCSNYATIEGTGDEFRNVTKMVAPTFGCTACSWHPSVGESPVTWRVYYAGRLEGTLIWAMNEEHMEVLVRVLETPPRRRKRVEFPWEYRALMSRLPHQATSGRFRNDMVSLIKRLQRTKPHGV